VCPTHLPAVEVLHIRRQGHDQLEAGNDDATRHRGPHKLVATDRHAANGLAEGDHGGLWSMEWGMVSILSNQVFISSQPLCFEGFIAADGLAEGDHGGLQGIDWGTLSPFFK